MPTKKKTIRKRPPRKSLDIPVTAAMLNEARHELKSEITSFRLEVDARFKQMDARFKQVDASVLEVKCAVEKVLGAVHRVGLLVEEQNARNKYVLDGYTLLTDRLDKIEAKSPKDL